MTKKNFKKAAKSGKVNQKSSNYNGDRTLRCYENEK
jgi:hypothetical protein